MKVFKNKLREALVIELYKQNPFTEFTIENMKPIRQKTWFGYGDIKSIIIEYNTDTSAGHPIKDDDIVRYSNENLRSLG